MATFAVLSISATFVQVTLLVTWALPGYYCQMAPLTGFMRDTFQALIRPQSDALAAGRS